MPLAFNGSRARRGRETLVSKTTVAIASAMLWYLISPVSGEPAEGFRVCADPDNLPFTSSGSNERGLYLDLAEIMAARMGVRAEYFWWPSAFGRRMLRETLLSNRCDALFGLPYDRAFAGKRVALTRPFLTVGYVVVAPKSLRVSQLDDLKGTTVGVQFATPPQLLLAARGGFQAVTFRFAEDVMDALSRREVESAFVWGPTAGYYNKRVLGGGFQIVPVDGPGLQWQVAIGVRTDNEALKTRLDREIEQLQPAILQLAGKYGFPLSPPLRLDASAKETPSPQEQASPRPPRSNAFSGDPSVTPAGRSLFNQHCSHCHSPNAINPDPSRDLRRLKQRYGENMTQVFYATVTEGRPTKGMPPWKGALSEETIWKILRFLESVQSEAQ